MNILTLCLSPGFGGLEIYVFRAAVALSAGHQVHAMLDNKLLDHFREHSDVKIIRRKRTSIHFPLISAYKTARYIDRHDIDIIHINWVKDLPVAVLSKLFSRKKPKIIYTRQMQITRPKKDLYHRFIYKNIDLILTLTEQLRRSCMKMIGTENTGQIRTLYPGVPAPSKYLSADAVTEQRKSSGLNENDFVVGLFGRLEHDKGQHLLIEAIALAKKNDIMLHALIVGHETAPGHRKKLQTLAHSLDVADQAIFHDFVNDPQSMMQLCDCITLTTYEETFGMVLPEAMRAGIAVIGSNRGGVPEIIDNNLTGLLFEPGDADDLYRQIYKLYQDRELRKKLAINGKKKADDIFNEDEHYNILEQYMTSLVEK